MDRIVKEIRVARQVGPESEIILLISEREGFAFRLSDEQGRMLKKDLRQLYLEDEE